MFIYIIKAIVCDQGSNLVKLFSQLCFTEEEINTNANLPSHAEIEKMVEDSDNEFEVNNESSSLDDRNKNDSN